MAQKWYLVNRRQNLSFLTLELALPCRAQGEVKAQVWRLCGRVSHIHFFGSVVHSVLFQSVDDRGRTGTILGISLRIDFEQCCGQGEAGRASRPLWDPQKQLICPVLGLVAL